MLVPPEIRISDETSYPFTQQELARLLVYRAAVQAGFYNESLTSVVRTAPGRQQRGDQGLKHV